MAKTPAFKTKAEHARYLFEHEPGVKVTEVAARLDMAYSQAHSIRKKMVPTGQAKASGAAQRQRRPTSDWGPAAQTPARKTTKPMTSPVIDAIKKGKPVNVGKIGTGRVGKLRTPGLPSDTDVGPCANCGHDLVVRINKTGFLMVHVNTTAEEYLAVTSFCQAVPEVLLA